ncbi:tubulin binding cofactor C domain-containing protein [Dictyostelium discoideum AX4]|uniref:Tubulin binding cofactor C domain-containing protein n=1 Tax=Dictyostelium discoideum TaxID=44689 RepID=Q54U82_DICDI|nr:tubulin binding cofactor C domain-containing protein [Dictyostelium discoideum AX4]EAL66907.1 tubulin binding cofactor C domain-containing protein [Dictyostelium discoideum AX4]|eukprot:XP_640894.1 tubulin binding cofactor C domain-containing protein [Dictyostelium discoideum AX4]
MIMNQFNYTCNVINQFKKTVLKTEQDFIGAPNGIINVNENNLDSPTLPKNYHLQSPTKLPYSAYIANHNNNNSNNNSNNTNNSNNNNNNSSNNFNINGVSSLSPILSPTSINNTNSPLLTSVNGGNTGSGLSVKLNLSNNKKSTIYILVNIAICTISNCHDSIIILGPCIDFIELSDCSKLTIISITKSIRIKSSNNISLYICCNQKPIIASDCIAIKLAPYNTHYPNLEQQLITSKLSTTLSNNCWNTPIILNSFSPLNSPNITNTDTNTNNNNSNNNNNNNNNKNNGIYLTIPPKLPLEPLDSNSNNNNNNNNNNNKNNEDNIENCDNDNDNENENEIKDEKIISNIYSILDAEEFFPFTVPFLIKGKTKNNPCELPLNYVKCLASKTNSVHSLHKLIQQTTNDPKTKATLLHLIESKFQEWLVETDNIRQINDLINMKR